VVGLEGLAHAALGVVNAIATGGYGAAAALGLWARARVEEAASGYRGTSYTMGHELGVPPGLLRAVDEAVAAWLGEEPLGGLEATIWSSIPLEAGLKGSSAVVNSLVEAVARLRGAAPPAGLELARLGVEAARRAGLTVTGALDDHLAVSGCGLYATDNRRQRLVAHAAAPPGSYAAVAAAGRLAITRVSRASYAALRGPALAAWRLLLGGDPWGAALLNGVVVAHSVGVEASLLARLSSLPGVLGAGVSGKGPAVYAVAVDEGAAAEAAEELARRLGAEPLVAPLLACLPGGDAPVD